MKALSPPQAAAPLPSAHPHLREPGGDVILTDAMIRYLRNLSTGRLILWCYFIWYLVVLVRYFDPNPRLWATSFGLCLIVGFALYVNTAHSGPRRIHLGFWPVVRLFMMPLCVSSFSALVKGRGFFLIFSPNPWEVGVAVAICAGLCAATLLAKRTAPASEEKASGLSPEAPDPA